ncbi:MAG: spore coat protein U domain-containing protein [Acidimicrobiia bacterium]|nr:spore coat protein U domain-containing protein [Acidimicrobiia bacterium]
MSVIGGKRTCAAVVAAGLILVGTSLPAEAAETATLTVSASVTNNCTISAAAISFAAYDPVVANATANLDGEGRVTIACTKGAVPTIGLGAGSNASGSTRRLASGAEMLTYEIYQNSSRSTVWNGGGGILTTTAAPSKAPRDYTVYGRITGGQDVAAGTYTDTIVATVNF